MHARDLAELAAQLATQASALIRTASEFDQKGIEKYWVASRCRLDRWSKTLREYSSRIHDLESFDKNALWAVTRPTLEEILISEVLTRIWTAVAIGHDRLGGRSELEPVARSILIGQLEARHRTLNLMVDGNGFGVEDAVALNRLRCQCERWSDMLLGAMGDEFDAVEFAFNVARVRETSLDLQNGSDQGKMQPQKALLASLRVSFQRVVREESANPDSNAQIASGIMSCFPADVFDSLGTLRPSWLLRMYRITEETQWMLNDVLASDTLCGSPETSSQRLEDQLRWF